MVGGDGSASYVLHTSNILLTYCELQIILFHLNEKAREEHFVLPATHMLHLQTEE